MDRLASQELPRRRASSSRRAQRSRNTVGPGYLDCLEAALLSAADDHRRAKEILQHARSRPTEGVRQPEIESLVTAYVAEAEGDYAAALTAWREVLEPPTVRHVMSLDVDVWPLYEIGRIEHDHGDPAAARDALGRFLEHWGNADRPLASIADARSRLARLEAR
jgi:hypothetical protein